MHNWYVKWMRSDHQMGLAIKSIHIAVLANTKLHDIVGADCFVWLITIDFNFFCDQLAQGSSLKGHVALDRASGSIKKCL